jgi:hypothetical protein
MGRTVVILTADHGGTGTSHSNAADQRNYTIPFLVWGTDVFAGADLYHLNHWSRFDPTVFRPDYNAASQPIRNGDSCNLALDLLELPSVPGSTINADQDLVVSVPATAVEGETALPFVELGAYPNPFSLRTEVTFDLERTGSVRLEVVDVQGRLVRVLEAGVRDAGRHAVIWNGRDSSGRRVASGVYFYRLETGNQRLTKKLLHVR